MKRERKESKFYCSYCGHTMTIPHWVKERICDFCHHKVNRDECTSVEDGAMLVRVQKAYERFMNQETPKNKTKFEFKSQIIYEIYEVHNRFTVYSVFANRILNDGTIRKDFLYRTTN